MIFDAVVDRDDFLSLTGEEVHAELSTMFPEKKLYCHSLDWRRSDEYILKAKGSLGDAVIGWRKERGQTRESNHKSNLWDSQSSHKTSIRSNEKGNKRVR